MFGGSWTQNMLEIAEGLSQSSKFDLTIIGSYEMESKIRKMFQNKNVKLYPLKNKLNESYPAFKQSVIKEMVAIQNKFT